MNTGRTLFGESITDPIFSLRYQFNALRILHDHRKEMSKAGGGGRYRTSSLEVDIHLRAREFGATLRQ